MAVAMSAGMLFFPKTRKAGEVCLISPLLSVSNKGGGHL